MSGRSLTVGGTLVGGLQDVAALLPLIGTEQCEAHVGSALAGGYLYAAATPLSIFGSLGIGKAGISVLFSSISISIPKVSMSFHAFKPTISFKHRKLLGARVLRDAGFKLSGTVAPLIAMDGHRLKAETRLLEILEEKHVDDPEDITVDWRSRQWNIMLIVTMVLGAGLSFAPYIALLLGPTSWRPTSIHLLWLFPTLRVVGSCTATAATQFIIQCRVISSMKNRIMFMTIHRRLIAIFQEVFDAWIEDSKIIWDPSLPAEQCIWNLENHISSTRPQLQKQRLENSHIQHDAGPISEETSVEPQYTSIPMATLQENRDFAQTQAMSLPSPASFPAPVTKDLCFTIEDLHQLQREHFPSPTRDTFCIVLSWIFLGISLPATVVGYIGCFTLVSAVPSSGNGPLVWVGVEAALSILRIFIWASNPSFDEETDVNIGLKLTKHQPMVTTNDYNPHITDLAHKERKPFLLVPEREFLEQITPYTGPLDRLKKADNFAIYFTLTTDYNNPEDVGQDEGSGSYESLCLLMTIFDINMGIGITIMPFDNSLYYFDVLIKYNTISRKMEAQSQSEKSLTHPWQVQDDILFDSLTKYYKYIIAYFSGRDITILKAALPWKWDLSQELGPGNHQAKGHDMAQKTMLPFLTTEDHLYLSRGYEHQLKTRLVANWSQWIVVDMGNLKSDKRNDCSKALKDGTNLNRKWELTLLDRESAWGWARRELVLLNLSLQLEDMLRKKTDLCAYRVNHVRKDAKPTTGLNLEFESERKKRLDQERITSKKRMEKAIKEASEQADREGCWLQRNQALVELRWTKVLGYIDGQWRAGIDNGPEPMKISKNKLKRMINDFEQMVGVYGFSTGLGRRENRWRFLHLQWDFQHELEERMMMATIEGIRIMPVSCTRKELETTYIFPQPDTEATAKFARLRLSTSQGKACTATVYDAQFCDKETVCTVISKTTTRSVVNVDPEIVASIPQNDHLIFLSCYQKGEGSGFVQRNRDRWWDWQKTNNWTFYFTPLGVMNGESCYSNNGTIAHIPVFLNTPSVVCINVLHCGKNVAKVSLQANGEDIISMFDIPQWPTFESNDFQSFVLQQGRHDLELIPQGQGEYFLRNIFINLSDVPTMNCTSGD